MPTPLKKYGPVWNILPDVWKIKYVPTHKTDSIQVDLSDKFDISPINILFSELCSPFSLSPGHHLVCIFALVYVCDMYVYIYIYLCKQKTPHLYR